MQLDVLSTSQQQFTAVHKAKIAKISPLARAQVHVATKVDVIVGQTPNSQRPTATASKDAKTVSIRRRGAAENLKKECAMPSQLHTAADTHVTRALTK